MTGSHDPFGHTCGLDGLGADVFPEAMGAPMPGESFLLVVSGMVADGVLVLWRVVLVAVVAVLGDTLGHLVGRRYGWQVVRRAGVRFGITEARRDRVERALEAGGRMIVTVARFFPLLRQLYGRSAGTIGMRRHLLLLAGIAVAVLWVGRWPGWDTPLAPRVRRSRRRAAARTALPGGACHRCCAPWSGSAFAAGGSGGVLHRATQLDALRRLR